MLLPGNHNRDAPNKETADLADQQEMQRPPSGQNGRCCGMNGICTHEVLRNGEATSDSDRKIVRKVVPSMSL